MLASEVIKTLRLVPLTIEGGYFLETYRARAPESSPDGKQSRSAGTCIYYLLDGKTISAWHKLEADEIWLYHLGIPARQLLLFKDGSWEERLIGPNLSNGERPQSLIPGGTWQCAVLDLRTISSRSLDGCGAGPGVYWGLYSAVVVPGFEYNDFVGGNAEELASQWPSAASLILSHYKKAPASKTDPVENSL